MGKDVEQSCGMKLADSNMLGARTTLLGLKRGPQAVSLPDFLLDLGLCNSRTLSAGIDNGLSSEWAARQLPTVGVNTVFLCSML